jgi:hypothetical protein
MSMLAAVASFSKVTFCYSYLLFLRASCRQLYSWLQTWHLTFKKLSCKSCWMLAAVPEVDTPMEVDSDQPDHSITEHEDGLCTLDGESHDGMPHAITWAKRGKKDVAHVGVGSTSSKHISDCPDRTSIMCASCKKRGCKDCAGKYCKNCCIAHSSLNQQYNCKVHRTAAHQTSATLGEGRVVISMPPQVRA